MAQERGLLARLKRGRVGTKHDELRWGRSLVIAAAMMCLVLLASVVMIQHINQTERQRCFDQLYREAIDIAQYVEDRIANDREELELLAAVIARSDDMAAPVLWRLLNSLEPVGMISDLVLLLPDDTLIHGAGEVVDARGKISFVQEAAHGAHVSARVTSIVDPELYILRHFVPVMRAGKTVAMLYGIISLQDFPINIHITPYDGKGAMYIVEGQSGNFLIDTWHPGKLTNMWDLGTRKVAPGYDPDRYRQSFAAGETGHLIFVSRTIGEYLYFHHRPMNINDWRIALSVPESVVFASSIYIEQVLNIFLAVEMGCFALYLMWLLTDVRRVTAEKQKRLETIQNIHEIEQFLFNAHERKENLYAAIERMGAIVDAARIDFWLLGSGINQHYRWEQDQQAVECDDETTMPPVKLLQNFASGADLYESMDPSELKALWPQAQGGSVIAVPVRNMIEGNLSGMIAVHILRPNALNVPLLKAMSFSFGMFCHNVKNRNDLQEQGDRDKLTGLYNRNRYERDLPELLERYQSGLTCVYIDVNGLRELNNTKGHDLGDIMLRTVAQAVNQYFPGPYQYRVGGDEFVLFVPGTDEAQLTKCSADIAAHLLEYDYHISVGIESKENIQSISHLIKAAEQKMYTQKREFYRGRERRMHVA